jgi:hypothetical protein
MNAKADLISAPRKKRRHKTAIVGERKKDKTRLTQFGNWRRTQAEGERERKTDRELVGQTGLFFASGAGTKGQ